MSGIAGGTASGFAESGEFFAESVGRGVFGFEVDLDFLTHSTALCDPAGKDDLDEKEGKGPECEVFPEFLTELIAIEESDELFERLWLGERDEVREEGVVGIGEPDESALGGIAFYGEGNLFAVFTQKCGKEG